MTSDQIPFSDTPISASEETMPDPNPFEMSEASTFYPTSHIDEILNGIILATLGKRRFIVLIGDQGVGKSVLLKKLASLLEADSTLVLKANADSETTVDDLIAQAGAKLLTSSPPDPGEDKFIQMIDLMEQHLEQAGSGLLIVDNAHHLSPDALQDLVDLARSDTETGRFLQILVSGTPALDRQLSALAKNAAHMDVLRFQLPCFTPDETARYVRHRMQAAHRANPFTEASLALVGEISAGNPAKIDALATEALSIQSKGQTLAISPTVIEEAAVNLGMPVTVSTPKPQPRPEPSVTSTQIHLPPPAAPLVHRPEENEKVEADPPRQGNSKAFWLTGTAVLLLLAGSAGAYINQTSPESLERWMTEIDNTVETWLANVLPDERSEPEREPIQYAEHALQEAPQRQPVVVEQQAPVAQAATVQAAPPPQSAPALQESGTQAATLTPPEPPQVQQQLPSVEDRVKQLADLALKQIELRQLTSPANQNAVRTIAQIEALSPGHPQAKALRQSIRDTYIRWASRAEERGNPEEARQFYQRALQATPNDPDATTRLAALNTPAQPKEDEVMTIPASDAGMVGFASPEAMMRALRRPEVLKAVAATGKDLDALLPNGKTPLMIAAENGHTESVDVLMGSNVDINARSVDGATALMYAAWNGRTDIVQKLLANGAAVNDRNSGGSTALMAAIARGHSAAAQELLNAGATVNDFNNDGWSALMYAAQIGHEELTRTLLTHGADPMQANQFGQSAAAIGARQGNPQIAALLNTSPSNDRAEVEQP